MDERLDKGIILKLKIDLFKFSFLLHFFWFVLILFMWNRQASASEAGSEILAMSITAIQVALAVLATILGVGAFAGFWILRGAAEEAAKEAAIETIRKAIRDGELSTGFGVVPELGSDETSRSTINIIGARRAESDGDVSGS